MHTESGQLCGQGAEMKTAFIYQSWPRAIRTCFRALIFDISCLLPYPAIDAAWAKSKKHRDTTSFTPTLPLIYSENLRRECLPVKIFTGDRGTRGNMYNWNILRLNSGRFMTTLPSIIISIQNARATELLAIHNYTRCHNKLERKGFFLDD